MMSVAKLYAIHIPMQIMLQMIDKWLTAADGCVQTSVSSTSPTEEGIRCMQHYTDN